MTTNSTTATKTEALLLLVKSQLATVSGAVYHKYAPDDAVYPYKVFSFDRVNISDRWRDDVNLIVDVYDRGRDSKPAARIADQIESLFREANLPQETILPTFYAENRIDVESEDKESQHIQLIFTIQNYERS